MSSDHDSDAIIHTVMKESQQQKKMSPTKKKKCSHKNTQIKTPDFHAWPIFTFWKWLELQGHLEWVKEAVA